MLTKAHRLRSSPRPLPERGFTLIELVLVITLLGILAINALPRFTTMTTQARQAARDGVVGAVRSGIALWRANSIVTGGADAYPATLEIPAVANGVCTGAVVCFEEVLENAVNNARWSKVGNVYTYADGTGNTSYTYIPSGVGAGSFQ